MWNERALTGKEVLLLFVALSLLYVYPLIHADYAYIDDNWRALLQGRDDWRNQGRILLELVYRGLTFSSGTVNIFPMPLLISILALALAMRRLTFWLFQQPRVSSCLVVLPILCNPYYLGNLTYQYDGPGMNLALVAVIYALTLRIEPVRWRGVAAAGLIAVALSLYQLTVGLFIGLCIIEFVVGLRNSLPACELLKALAQRMAQLIGGGVLYFLTAYQLINQDRGVWIALDASWAQKVAGRFSVAMEQIALVVTPGNSLVVVAILLLAAFGFFQVMRHLPRLEGGATAKVAVAVLYGLSVPALIVGVPGIMLFFVWPALDARNFIAFSAVLIFLFFLSDHVLGQVWPRLRLLLLVPTLLMFSLCYAYGQVIIAKKELAFAMAGFIAGDIVSREGLQGVKRFYYLGPGSGGNWLPRAYPAKQAMPVLEHVLSTGSTLLQTQFLPRLGITNVVLGDRRTVRAITDQQRPVVDSKFYSIYRVDDTGFIVMKPITDLENYKDNWPGES